MLCANVVHTWALGAQQDLLPINSIQVGAEDEANLRGKKGLLLEICDMHGIQYDYEAMHAHKAAQGGRNAACKACHAQGALKRA